MRVATPGDSLAAGGPLLRRPGGWKYCCECLPRSAVFLDHADAFALGEGFIEALTVVETGAQQTLLLSVEAVDVDAVQEQVAIPLPKIILDLDTLR